MRIGLLGRDVVSLVDDEDVEREALAGAGEGVAQLALGALAGQPCHRDDDPREQRERVGVDAVGSAYVFHGLGVDDREVEAELLLHLVLPLEGQTGGADHDHRARPVAQQELLDHQARLDRLAEADVIGEQEVGAGLARARLSGVSW